LGIANNILTSLSSHPLFNLISSHHYGWSHLSAHPEIIDLAIKQETISAEEA
jgi:hypothetical protein